MALLLSVSGVAYSAPIEPGENQCRLNILLTNDDGWQAPGIQTLLSSLRTSGHNVTLVAPETQQSGKSSAVNAKIGEPVSIISHGDDVWSVSGSPADSVKAALGIIFANKDLPNLVVSGANFGPNIGQQTALHSGTVGASLTAHHAGIPAIAVSVGIDFKERDSSPRFKSTLEAFPTTAQLLDRLLINLIRKNGCDKPLPSTKILSLNVPVPVDQIKGIRYAPLSPNDLFHLIWKAEDGVNKVTFKPADKSAAINNDDVGYFLRKYVTVTSLSGDLTQTETETSRIKSNWLPKLPLVEINN